MICFFRLSRSFSGLPGRPTSPLSPNPGLSSPIHVPWELPFSPTHLRPAGRAMRPGADVLGLQQTTAERD